MSKVFVIPDVHLKPWIFEMAEEKLSSCDAELIVMLGDLADDWDCGSNLGLYRQTYDAAAEFAKKHPSTLLCYGNHDMSYEWEAMESGYSWEARDIAVEGQERLRNVLFTDNCAYIHIIDKVIFSHGGLTKSFAGRYFDSTDDVSEYGLLYMIKRINSMGKSEMWEDDSPLWARPQRGAMELFPSGYVQVVGHTPVRRPLEEECLLTLDTFSTYPNGNPFGNE